MQVFFGNFLDFSLKSNRFEIDSLLAIEFLDNMS